MAKKLSIFISHPSELLTDHQPHGDGLIAFNFIHRLAQRGHSVYVAGPSVKTISSIDIQGEIHRNIKTYPVKLLTSYETLNPTEYLLKVKQIFKQVDRIHKLDVIHQLNPVFPGLSYSLTGQGRPIVLGPFWPDWPADSELPQYKASLLGSISSAITSPLMQWCDYQQQQHSSALLLSTPAAKSKLYESGTVQDKIRILSPGIDTETFYPAEDITHSQKNLSILYLASLNQRKGIFTLLDAFEYVARSIPDCRLLIAGAGCEQQKINHQIKTMPCRSQITLLGGVEREKVPTLMQQCTLYCLPSYSEPFGMSALEAMACGKPVVATNTGGLAHLVPEEGSRKVPPKDPKALADALIEILSSLELQHRMGKSNRLLVESEYSWDRVIDRLEKIYYGLVANQV